MNPGDEARAKKARTDAKDAVDQARTDAKDAVDQARDDAAAAVGQARDDAAAAVTTSQIQAKWFIVIALIAFFVIYLLVR